MSNKQNIDIPIIGLDRRPSYRQETPGLCSDIVGLEPTGTKESPYWKGIPNVDILRNDNGIVFSHPKQDTIIGAKFTLQSRNSGPNTERLVLVFSDGTMDIVDPNGSGDWEVVTSYEFDGVGDFGVDFAITGSVLIVSITKDETPFKLLYVYRDDVIPYGFPNLPRVTMAQDSNLYTEAEVQADAHTGLKSGEYAYRYGFIMGGEVLAMSPPIPFTVDLSDFTFSELEFTLGGYDTSNAPKNYNFWKDVIDGIGVYVSGHYFNKEDLLIEGLYYQVAYFDSIDKRRDYIGSENPNIKRYKGTAESTTARRLYNVVSEGHHNLSAGSIFSYNSRLLLGRVSVDFTEPPESIESTIEAGVAISPISITTEEQPVQGDPYETTKLTRLTFRLTSFGGVLPEYVITETVNIDFVGSSQVDDQNVDYNLYHDESLSGPLTSEIEFLVTAQAYQTMNATPGEEVGGEFTFKFPEDN